MKTQRFEERNANKKSFEKELTIMTYMKNWRSWKCRYKNLKLKFICKPRSYDLKDMIKERL